MLQITVPSTELLDERTNTFVSIKEQNLCLEHSLVSMSKWESKWCKAFLSKQDKTEDEMLDYIKCMTVTSNVDPNVYLCLTVDNINRIRDYIDAPMTATYISDENNKKANNEKVTSELIYYWMIALNIPFECQKWHLNRLITLVRVCNIKNQPPKKRSKREIASRNTALNALRKKQLNTRG